MLSFARLSAGLRATPVRSVAAQSNCLKACTKEQLSHPLSTIAAAGVPHESYDFVIVGAGSAGCVLANRLSANQTTSYLYTMMNPRTCWCFQTTPQKGLNGRRIGYPRGKVMGGCSSINGMIYMRGQPEDFQLWHEAGGSVVESGVGEWSWEDVTRFYNKGLDYTLGDSELYTSGGEWRVEKQRLHWDILDTWQKAAHEVAGIPPVKHFNHSSTPGSGLFQVNQRSGVRLSAYRAFVHPIRDRPNLSIRSSAQIEGLSMDGKRVTGVQFRHQKGGLKTALATKEVVLSAGAIGSPHILQVSGVGPAELLHSHGVECLHDLPAVGQNLQDHLQIRSVFRLENAVTLNARARTWWGKLLMGIEYTLFQSGPLAMAPSQLGAFAKSSPDMRTPDLQYHVQPLSLDSWDKPLHPFSGLTASVCNLRPSSRGSVTLSGPSTFHPPSIDPNYLSTEHDRKVAAESLRLTRRIMKANAIAQHSPSEHFPGEQFHSDEDLARESGNIGTSIFHPVGTCAMGTVVDARLRVLGLRGLRVADASIMPNITSGNTNSPCLMIGEKAADMILKDHGLSPTS